MKKIFLLTLLSFLFSPLWADVSPKPEMAFSFIYNTEAKPLINPLLSEQIQCKDNQCMETKPLGKYGIQKLYCSAGTCFSIAYEYDHFQKLIIAFEDGSKRESNVFQAPDSLRSRFNVYVDQDKLTVEPTDLLPPASDWVRTDAWLSLGIILVLELLAAAMFLAYIQKPFTVLYSVALANLLTTTISWLVLARYVKETAFLWFFCLLTETLIIRLMNKRKMSLKNSFLLSLAINVTSYSLGMIIAFWLDPLIF